jgi:hypothetical protein
MSISGMALARLGQVYPMRPIIPPMNMIRRRKGRIGECAARDDDSAGKVCSGFRESAPSKNNAMVMRFYRQLLSTSHQPLDDANERCARRASPDHRSVGIPPAELRRRRRRAGEPERTVGGCRQLPDCPKASVTLGELGEQRRGRMLRVPGWHRYKNRLPSICRPMGAYRPAQSETPPVIESDSSDR